MSRTDHNCAISRSTVVDRVHFAPFSSAVDVARHELFAPSKTLRRNRIVGHHQQQQPHREVTRTIDNPRNQDSRIP
ncbi:hypothetical protein [Williamsia serinedens]|uniref:hypothetical protein n=1 Tax=Williamsia serinedens TaxID=391736 RepID=UPI0020A612CB|nr:hypothetical protein [Williamsia serinedens]